MRIFFQKPKAVPYHQANKDKRPAESQHCCLQQCQWQLIQLICVVCVKYKAEPNSMKLKKIDSRWERKVLCIYFRLWKYLRGSLKRSCNKNIQMKIKTWSKKLVELKLSIRNLKINEKLVKLPPLHRHHRNRLHHCHQRHQDLHQCQIRWMMNLIFLC